MYYDVVIVGSGVAGSMSALRLVQQGYSVLVLEAGATLQRGNLVQASRNSARADSMAPNPFLKHAPHPDPVQMPDYIESSANPYETSYIRATGGTTWHWGGRGLAHVGIRFQNA